MSCFGEQWSKQPQHAADCRQVKELGHTSAVPGFPSPYVPQAVYICAIMDHSDSGCVAVWPCRLSTCRMQEASESGDADLYRRVDKAINTPMGEQLVTTADGTPSSVKCLAQ